MNVKNKKKLQQILKMARLVVIVVSRSAAVRLAYGL